MTAVVVVSAHIFRESFEVKCNGLVAVVVELGPVCWHVSARPVHEEAFQGKATAPDGFVLLPGLPLGHCPFVWPPCCINFIIESITVVIIPVAKSLISDCRVPASINLRVNPVRFGNTSTEFLSEFCDVLLHLIRLPHVNGSAIWTLRHRFKMFSLPCAFTIANIGLAYHRFKLFIGHKTILICVHHCESLCGWKFSPEVFHVGLPERSSIYKL